MKHNVNDNRLNGSFELNVKKSDVKETLDDYFQFLETKKANDGWLRYDVLINNMSIISQSNDPDKFLTVFDNIRPTTKIIFIKIYKNKESNSYTHDGIRITLSEYGSLSEIKLPPVKTNEEIIEGLAGYGKKSLGEIISEVKEQAKFELSFENLKKQYEDLKIECSAKDQEIEELDSELNKTLDKVEELEEMLKKGKPEVNQIITQF